MHNNFLEIAGVGKMAKSGDNFITLRTVVEKKISPIAYRFWLLMAHYRTKMNFNWEALEGAEIALKRLYGLYLDLGDDIGAVDKDYQQKFKEYMEDDLDTPRALTLLWSIFKEPNISNADKKATVLDFDKIFGLGFENVKLKAVTEINIPDVIKNLLDSRDQARTNKDFKKSDELRKKINSLGYEINDTPDGQKISLARNPTGEAKI
jgi:cysteinyl-tRNA synthetase